MLTHAHLAGVRRTLPGFGEMEDELTRWLHAEYGVVCELFYAHGLRQGPHTLQSTGFAVHQDTEEFDFIDFSVRPARSSS